MSDAQVGREPKPVGIEDLQRVQEWLLRKWSGLVDRDVDWTDDAVVGAGWCLVDSEDPEEESYAWIELRTPSGPRLTVKVGVKP